MRPAQAFAYIQIEPTTRCNYSCGFCVGRALPQRDIDFDLFKSIIDLSEGLVHVELQGEGEPMLHPRFSEMLGYLRERRPAVRTSFITNGSLTQSSVQSILDSGVNKILVSLETSANADFGAMRGGSLDAVTSGIKLLMAARQNQQCRGPSVGFAVTILRRTLGALSGIGELYEELGMDGGITFQPLQHMSVYTEHYSAEFADQIPSDTDLETVRKQIVADRRLLRILRTPPAGVGFYADLQSSCRRSPPTCPWLESGLFVTAGGVAVTCCFVKETERFGLAAWDAVNLETISRKRADILATLQSGQTPDQCRECTTAARVTAQDAAQ